MTLPPSPPRQQPPPSSPPSAPSSFSHASTRLNKSAFLRAYSPQGQYGYPELVKGVGVGQGDGHDHDDDTSEGSSALGVDQLRKEEFPQLFCPSVNQAGLVYLDHGGATLYGKTQLQRTMEEMMGNVYGNPHSRGPAASLTSETVESARAQVLRQLGSRRPDHHKVLFTSGTTAAIKMVAESFPWSTDSHLLLALHSHTSVIGIREYAQSGGATCQVLADLPSLSHTLSLITTHSHSHGNDEDEGAAPIYHLIAWPAECNFTGARVDWSALSSLPRKVGRHHFLLLLDAAKYVSTASLELDTLAQRADMVCLSFYKMFGYPTGLGCLVVERSIPSLLCKRYYGGGTVQAVVASTGYRVLREEAEARFADGTVHYLGITALRHGYQALEEVGGMVAIGRHTSTLARFLHDQLASMRHADGSPVCELYSSSSSSSSSCGAIITFNIKRPGGGHVGYAEVEKLASLHRIQLRTGCFCNPGACQRALGLTDEEVVRNLQAGHVCWDENDIIEGRPTGAVRVSLGYMSTWEDTVELLHVIDKYFVSKSVHVGSTTSALLQETTAVDDDEAAQATSPSPPLPLRLSGLTLYPIKSCAGMSVTRWPLCSTGLLFDREWAIVDQTGRTLRMKVAPRMCLIHPHVHLDTQQLIISSPGMPDLTLPLSYVPPPSLSCHVNVCGDHTSGLAYDQATSEWFTTFLHLPCTLVRSSPYAERRTAGHNGGGGGGVGHSSSSSSTSSTTTTTTTTPRPQIAFSNEAQLLLVCTASVDHLNGLIQRQTDLEYEFLYEGQRSNTPLVTADNFRPNLLVSGGVAHQEDLWTRLSVGGLRLRVTGPCSRCAMVNIDHRDGSKNAPVLKTLASYRREKAQIYFGQFLAMEEYGEGEGEEGEAGWVQVGSPVNVQTVAEGVSQLQL